MAIAEKTFELNVTHEILTAADALWNVLEVVLGRHPRAPAVRPATAIGLTLRDEQRKGWDVRIDLPGSTRRARCVFLQFKAPKHFGFTRRSPSRFRGNWRSHRPHCAFGVNNNSSRDQHIILRGLASDPSNAGAVLYALPRLTTPQAVKHWAGRMALMTSFLSVRDIDDLAKARGTAITTGNAHEFRTSYDGAFGEIHSTPIDASSIRNQCAALVAEICAVRAWRALQSWSGAAREADIPSDAWGGIAASYRSNITRHWTDPLQFEDLVDIDSYAAAMGSLHEIDAEYDALATALRRTRIAILEALDQRLAFLTESLATGRWIYELPAEPEAELSVRLDSDSVLHVSADERLSADHADWGAVSYMIF